MKFGDLLKVISRNTQLTVIMQSKTGYETSFDFSRVELNRANPKLANAKVTKVEVVNFRLTITVSI